jgi:hypothetical protein
MNFSQNYTVGFTECKDPKKLFLTNLWKSVYNLCLSVRNLRSLLLIFATYFIQFPSFFAQDTLLVHYSNTITKEELSAHVYRLASVEFEGRFTGSRGQLKAEKYITGEFKRFGLEMPMISGRPSYTQEFALDNCRWKDQALFVDTKKLNVGKDFLFLSDPVNITGTFPVIFSGYGIEDSAYSDMEGLDVSGKIMVVFAGEPRNEDGISLISGEEHISKKGYYFEKEALASAKGAAGIVIIPGDHRDIRRYLKNRQYYDEQPHLTYPAGEEDPESLSQGFSAFMNVKSAARMLDEKPSGLRAVRQEMQDSKKTAAGRFEHKVQIAATSLCFPLKTANVIGIVEGTDLKNETVVIVAHYDHLGMKGGEIFYGADDNATGTAAIMEVAEAFALAAADGYRPRRTLVFLAATAEEIGLFGSRYYSEHPVLVPDSAYACINIDMIGRTSEKFGPAPEYISGFVYLSPGLLEISRENCARMATGLADKIELKKHVNRVSDHYNFAARGIPSIFYHTGLHSDYHKPTDTADKILYDRMEKIVQTIFATAWELANREGKL